MLYLTRKAGQSVIINNAIELTVIEIKGSIVRLGFQFPPEVSILRKELHEKIMQQNLAASETDAQLLHALADVPADAFDHPPCPPITRAATNPSDS